MKGLKVQVREGISTGAVKVGLDVVIIPSSQARKDIDADAGPDGITLLWEYNLGLLEGVTGQQLLGHYVAVLDAMVADDSQLLDRLPILPEAERRKVLYEWNETAVEYPKEKCIHELFEEQVERTPDAVAVVYEEQQLTYRELNSRANQLGHYLRELGVKPDSRVAICVERGLEMVVGLLAVLKAGGAYVPLDPGYPAERLRYMLEDSAPVVLLTQGDLQKLFSGISESLPVLDLTAIPAGWRQESEANLDCAAIGVTARHLAYVIYTSGSTGMPKGVMVEHANVARLFAATDAWFHFNAKDIWGLFHSYAFDFSRMGDLGSSAVWWASDSRLQRCSAFPG